MANPVIKGIVRAGYLLRETGLGLGRGGWMTWAAVSTMTALLLWFGLGLQVTWQLERGMQQLGSQVEVAVYLAPEMTGDELGTTIAQWPQVSGVIWVSKEEAWAELQAALQVGDGVAMTTQLRGNPLVDALRVQAQDAAVVSALAQRLRQLPGVEAVFYGNEVVQRVLQLQRGVKWIGGGVVAVLTLTAIAVITTTIRLIVLARRREIEVMQLVGAGPGWIYGPFLMQGLLFGLGGAAIASAILHSFNQALPPLAQGQPALIQTIALGLHLSPTQGAVLSLGLAGAGAIVGLLGSLIAVRKVSLP